MAFTGERSDSREIACYISLFNRGTDMIAYLTDENGAAIERLKDIPVSLTAEEESRDYWQFPVASSNSNNAYDVISVKLSDFVTDSGARIRVFSFTNKSQHKAILDYMDK